jgi:hypothetical protein
MIKVQLTKSRSSRDRHYLIRDGKGMGGGGKPEDHYLNRWVVVTGVDRGNGYQGYMSVDYALTCDWLPDGAKAVIRDTLHVDANAKQEG